MDVNLREDIEDIIGDLKVFNINNIDDNAREFIISIPKKEFGGLNKSNMREETFSFIIHKENEDVFTCKVVENGFYVENPNLRRIYENKKFSKEELKDFIIELPSLEKNIRDLKSIKIGEFYDILANDEIHLVGINQSFYSNNDRIHFGDYEKKIHSFDILYLKDSNDKVYRLELLETHGMDNDDFRTNRFGHIQIEEVDSLPQEFNFVSKEDFILKQQLFFDTEPIPNAIISEDEEVRSIDIDSYVYMDRNENAETTKDLIPVDLNLTTSTFKLEYDKGTILNFAKYEEDKQFDESFETSRILLSKDELLKYFNVGKELSNEEVVSLDPINYSMEEFGM